MSSQWQTVPIGDIVEDVYDGPHATPAKTKSGPVFLGIWNLVDGRVDLSTTEHLSEDDFPLWTRRVLPQAGDIVFSYETKLGCAAMIPQGLRCCLGRRMALIRPLADKVDGRFLLYSFLGPQFQREIRVRTVPGSTVDRIALMEFPRYPVRLPCSLPEQRAIAGVLGALDDKIEVNRKTARVLEGIARGVFTSWFVDFDPVRRHPHPPHTAASHPGSGAARRAPGPAPLPADLAALFPTRLVDSPIGEVPEGWRVGTLGEVCEKPQYGLTASAADEAVGPKFLRITDINKEPWINWTTVPFCEIPAGEDAAKYRLRKGDLVIARMADPGHTALIEEDRDAVFASYLIRFRPRAAETARYLQYWTRSPAYWDLVHGRKTGSTRATLNATELGELPMLIPPAPAMVRFTAIVDALRARGVHAMAQSATLAALRDALLPKLISGELRIADAEKIIGRAL